MLITHLALKNWRNFLEVDVPLRERTYLLGANASGKSNLLDVFRFLRDVSKTQGGGLQKAVSDRGGIPKLRCLHTRRDPDVCIEIHISDDADDTTPRWRYILAFKPEERGLRRTLITKEEVWKGKTKIISRPDSEDKKDPARLTQTHLEQIQTNAKFREIAQFLGEITYLHLVPQLLKHGEAIGGRRLEDDPFGQGFLERIAKTPEKTRRARLKKINEALVLAVPQFKELRFIKDSITGYPHLEARYAHHRPNAGWQREDQFSDGTLRLLGLLWALLEKNSLLLLEEPEMSLNDAIIKEIPILLQKVQRNKKKRRQIIISTHSETLLSNPGIDGRGVLLFDPGAEGTKIRSLDKSEKAAIKSGLSISEVALPKTRPKSADQLAFW